MHCSKNKGIKKMQDPGRPVKRAIQKSVRKRVVRLALSAILFILLLSFISNTFSQNTALNYLKIRILPPDSSSKIIHSAIAIFTERLEQRTPAKVVASDSDSSLLTIRLQIKPGIGKEGYEIRRGRRNGIEIIGNDDHGVLYGLGKLLHTSNCSNKGFTPGPWQGVSVPACPVRGIYFACHFKNFYEVAPLNEIKTYVEDLAFWGLNAIVFNFPQWQYDAFDDPQAQSNIERIRLLMKRAKEAGFRVGLIEAVNQGFRTAPEEIRNDPYPDDWGRRGNLGTSICPGKPAGHTYLLDFWRRLFNEYNDPGLDYLIFWPYDEGGCGCSECWPWGARGYLHLTAEITGLARERWPDCRFILSTWMYDSPPAGEWAGLSRALANEPRLTDFVLADAHEDFPRYPLENPLPAQIPLLNFPEISMWGMSPWGGYGANPLPSRLQILWDQVRTVISGGFPYSEGIYEDINKVIYSQFYWFPGGSAIESVKAYASAYFSPGVAETVAEAVEILEKNHKRRAGAQFSPLPGSTRKALELMNKAGAQLSDQVCRSWRWRILYLRARIDNLLAQTNGRLQGRELRTCFDELIDIYHAENVHTNKVAPPEMQAE